MALRLLSFRAVAKGEYMNNDKVISTLNGLIETCKDGEEGFRTAAEGLTDPQTRSEFQSYSRDRGQMAHELQAEVRRLGGDPDKAGSMSGAIHRGWINIKSVVTGKDDGSIISEAERGEDAAKKAYDHAISSGLSGAALALVQQQRARVHSTHDRVRALEKATTPSR
jgi:uncharacterized protein (TIGR02284 family)